MKDTWGWIVGIGTAIVIFTAGSLFLALVDVPTWIDFGRTISVTRGSGRYSYDEEIDGESTAIGTALTLIGILVGCLTGARAAGGSVSPTSLLQGKAMIGGLAIYGIGGAIAFKLFPGPGVLGWAVDLAVAAVAFFVMREWYRKRLPSTTKPISEQPKTSHFKADVAAENSSKPEILYFKDGWAFFEYHCKYGRTEFAMEKPIIGVVKELHNAKDAWPPGKEFWEWIQSATVAVISSEGGFTNAAVTEGPGPPLNIGDVVFYFPTGLDSDVRAKLLAEGRSEKLAYFGRIIARLKPEIDVSQSESGLVLDCVYKRI